jgi:cytochrome bd-type quinol oxidase subunit 2
MNFLFALGAALIVLAGIAYLAISKKSSFRMRVAALVALAVMVLTVIASVFMVFMFSGETVSVDPSGTGLPDIPPDAVQVAPEQGNNVLLVSILFLLALFLLVMMLILWERRRNKRRNAGR